MLKMEKLISEVTGIIMNQEHAIEEREESTKNIRELLDKELNSFSGFGGKMRDDVYTTLWKEVGRLEREMSEMSLELVGMEKVLNTLKEFDIVKDDESIKVGENILGGITSGIVER